MVNGVSIDSSEAGPQYCVFFTENWETETALLRQSESGSVDFFQYRISATSQKGFADFIP